MRTMFLCMAFPTEESTSVVLAAESLAPIPSWITCAICPWCGHSDQEGDPSMETGASSASRGRAESIRSGRCDAVPISSGVWVRDLVSKTCGAKGFSTFTASFDVGSRLQYHSHGFSEAIVVLSGMAQVAVEGRRYFLKAYDC